MRTTHVVVKSYDKKWKTDFEDIKKEIQMVSCVVKCKAV